MKCPNCGHNDVRLLGECCERCGSPLRPKPNMLLIARARMEQARREIEAQRLRSHVRRMFMLVGAIDWFKRFLFRVGLVQSYRAPGFTGNAVCSCGYPGRLGSEEFHAHLRECVTAKAVQKETEEALRRVRESGIVIAPRKESTQCS